MSPVVETEQGRVRGVRRARHTAFRGIPFAKPPVGQRRFLPPEAPEAWPGVRDAQAFGPSAPQGRSFAPGSVAEGPSSEDCLTLNVYTPACDGGRRPVLFWIHGGAFVVGSASADIYDGGPLCETGDVVVVTTNYRLGVLGFLHLGEDGARWGAGDNLALQDQIAALRWVGENIEAFGGDPRSVTIFGESAGGSSVAALLVAPAARGLFERAIAQSSAATLRLPSSEDAMVVTERVLGALGLARDQTEQLREMPVERLLDAQHRARQGGLGLGAFRFIRDPKTLPDHPLDAFGAGAVPLIIGANRDEWNLFAIPEIAEWEAPLSDGDAIARLSPTLAEASPEAIAELLEAYRRSRTAASLPAGNHALVRAVEGDLRFRMASLWWAEAYGGAGATTFSYLFSYESPALRGSLRACHALELPFVFGTLDAPMQDRFAGSGLEASGLSRRMMGHWIAFARTGDPSLREAPWPPFDLAGRRTMVFDRESRLEGDPFQAERLAWQGLRPSSSR